MKIIWKKLIFTCLVGFGLGSCTDDLTLTPISQITNASFWKSPQEARGALNGMYVRMRSQATTNLFVWGEGRSEVWVQNFGFDPSINFFVYTNNLSRVNPGPDWTTMYSVVHDANLLLKYVPTITFATEAEKNTTLAQAYAMRAFTYFTMTKIWGDLILIEQPTEGFDPTTIYKERAPQADVFKLIKSDIEKALTLFPDNTLPNGRNRWSKPALNALKADVFLWTAKRLNGGATDFNAALSAISEIEKADVALLSSFSDVFRFANKGNKEILLSMRFQEGESSARTVLGGVPTLTAPTVPFTSQEVINKILPYYAGKDSYWQMSTLVTKQFSDDDSRKSASFIEVNQTRNGTTSFMYNIDLKWPGTTSGGITVMFDDFILYRYADVILMKAEAKNGLGQSPAEEMNKIRQRAYGAKFANYTFVNGTKEANDEAILQERLFEFLNEGKRWWDLVRFNKALEKVPLLKGKTQNDLLYPISETILSLEPLVKQNPGY